MEDTKLLPLASRNTVRQTAKKQFGTVLELFETLNLQLPATLKSQSIHAHSSSVELAKC